MNTVKHKSITRYDGQGKRDKRVYWWVRIYWGGKVPLFSERFLDVDYGGSSERSLKAAIKFRDAAELAIGKLRSERQVFCVVGSNTGILGVTRGRGKLQVSSPSGWRTSVSVRKYGLRTALQIAEQKRLGHMETISP